MRTRGWRGWGGGNVGGGDVRATLAKALQLSVIKDNTSGSPWRRQDVWREC